MGRPFFLSGQLNCSTLTVKFVVSWTENPHLSFRGTDVSTFLRLFYDTFHRDRAVRQLLLTAFQYLRMRPASGWDRVRRGWTLLPSSLVTGNESDMVVRAMSDEMIKSWTRLTEGYANVGGTVQKKWDRGSLNSSRLISLKNDFTFMGFCSTLIILWYCTLHDLPATSAARIFG